MHRLCCGRRRAVKAAGGEVALLIPVRCSRDANSFERVAAISVSWSSVSLLSAVVRYSGVEGSLDMVMLGDRPPCWCLSPPHIDPHSMNNMFYTQH